MDQLFPSHDQHADTYNNSANSANIIYRSSSTTIVGNNASAVVIEDAGNVGIGTTDPSVKLDVNGTIKTTLTPLLGLIFGKVILMGILIPTVMLLLNTMAAQQQVVMAI